MKKFLTVFVLVLIVCVSLFAGDFKFLFTELDQHMELLDGFLPTLITVGESYEGFEFIPGNLTQIQATVGGGLSSRYLFLNPVTGKPLDGTWEPVLVFDAWQLRWNLKMLQGFGDSWVPGKDLITAYAGYEGRWEQYEDYLILKNIALPKDKLDDKYRKLGMYSEQYNETALSVPFSIDKWFGQYGTSDDPITRDNSSVYPDFAGKQQFFTNFYTGATWNYMQDEETFVKGAKAELKFQFAPGFANKQASYYSATLNAVGGYTVFQLKQQDGLNLFSVTLKDRANLNYTDGKKVPVYATSPVSLGRKVRGFDTNSYGTNFSFVNNFDIRLAGPEAWMNNLFPRVNLFLDAGYHGGDYFNTEVSGKDFLCSTGFQAEVCFWGVCDIGIQYSYLIKGTNLRDQKNNLIMGATFFLDF